MMSKVTEEIVSRMSAEAAEEFRQATEGMYLLDNSGGSYLRKEKAEAEIGAARKELEAGKADFATRLAELEKELEARGVELAQLRAGNTEQERERLERRLTEMTQAHQEELALMKAQYERDKKSLNIRQDLILAGAIDPDLAFTALGLDTETLDALEYDAGGNLAGHAERIKELQESKTFLFNVRSPRGTHIPPVENDGRAGNMVQEALAQIGYK